MRLHCSKRSWNSFSCLQIKQLKLSGTVKDVKHCKIISTCSPIEFLSGLRRQELPSPLPSPSSHHFWDQPGLNLQHHCHSTLHYHDFWTLVTKLARILCSSPEIVLSQCRDLQLGSHFFFSAPAPSKQQPVSCLIPSHLQTVAEFWAAHSSLQDPPYFSFMPAFLLPSRSSTYFFFSF